MEHEDTSQQVRDSLLKDPELRARVSRYVGSVVIEEFLNREHDPVKWKVGDVVKCMCGNADFELGKLYKIANISKDHIMLQTSPKKRRWASVNNFKLIGDNHGTHSR